MDDDDPLRPIAIGARALVLAALAYWAWRMGVLVMAGAIVWGGSVLREQHRRLRTADDRA